MFEKTQNEIPEDHPLRTFFRDLTERGFGQSNLHDEETIQYVTNLLTDFLQIENMYRIKDERGRRVEYLFELLTAAANVSSSELRRVYYKHLGDLTLFNLGLFPESLTYGRRTVSVDYYAEQGRRSYYIVAEMQPSQSNAVYRKLVDQFQQCVMGLNWVKMYMNDPFYQYMFREFNIT